MHAQWASMRREWELACRVWGRHPRSNQSARSSCRGHGCALYNGEGERSTDTKGQLQNLHVQPRMHPHTALHVLLHEQHIQTWDADSGIHTDRGAEEKLNYRLGHVTGGVAFRV